MLERILLLSKGKNIAIAFKDEDEVIHGRLVHSKTRGYMLRSPPENWGFAQRMICPEDIIFLLLKYDSLPIESQQARTFKRFRDREGAFVSGEHYIDGFPLAFDPEKGILFADPALSWNFNKEEKKEIDLVRDISERDIALVGRCAWLSSYDAEPGFNIPLRRRIDEFFHHQLVRRESIFPQYHEGVTEMDCERNYKLHQADEFLSLAEGIYRHNPFKSAVLFYNTAVIYESIDAPLTALGHYRRAHSLMIGLPSGYDSLSDFITLRIKMLQSDLPKESRTTLLDYAKARIRRSNRKNK